MAVDLNEVDLTAVDLTKKGKVKEFAAIVGITTAAVYTMFSENKLNRDETLGQWIKTYVGNIREHAGGRGGELAESRTQLAIEQTRAAKLKNDIAEGAAVSPELISLMLLKISAKMNPIFSAVPKRLAAQIPYLEKRDLPIIAKECDAIRIEAGGVEMTMEDFSR